MSETSGKYHQDTIKILMNGAGGIKEEKYGFRPIDVRSRVEKLLAIEKRARAMCIANNIPKDWKCPSCGLVHHLY